MNVERLKQGLESRRPTMMGSWAGFAVLCPLVKLSQGQWGLLFEVRASSLRAQPKEVCFPGGRMEPGETPIQSALRETQEEVGIPPKDITVLGELDFIAHTAGFIVHPVAAVVEDLTALCPSKAEVDHTFVVPLTFFQTTQPLQACYDLVPNPHADFPYQVLDVPNPYPFRTREIRSPVWVYQGHAIWGMTACTVEHLLQLLENLQE